MYLSINEDGIYIYIIEEKERGFVVEIKTTRLVGKIPERVFFS